MAASLGQLGASAPVVAVWEYVKAQGTFLLLAGSWVIGHLLGYVIMGIALIRSRAIPLWAAILIIVGLPFQAAGYGAHVCFALIFLGSVPATLAMLKLRDEQVLGPVGEEPAPTT